MLAFALLWLAAESLRLILAGFDWWLVLAVQAEAIPWMLAVGLFLLFLDQFSGNTRQSFIALVFTFGIATAILVGYNLLREHLINHHSRWLFQSGWDRFFPGNLQLSKDGQFFVAAIYVLCIAGLLLFRYCRRSHLALAVVGGFLIAFLPVYLGKVFLGDSNVAKGLEVEGRSY